MCHIVCICVCILWYSVWICVNMCHFVSYCVVLCVFLCVLCVFVRISASRIVGCVFPPPKLMYRTASRMSYLLRCQFWGVQSWGCVYMCVFGGVSIWGVSVSICVNCVYSCVYCVYLYVFWCEILWIPVEMCEILCFVSVFVNSMEWRRTTQIEAVGFSIWMFFLFFEFLMNFLWMYVFFWIFLYFDWFSLIFFWFFYGFHWFFWFELILNGFWGSENGEKTGFLEWLWKCLKMSKKWVFGT